MLSVCRAQDGGSDSLSLKAADSDGGGSSSAEDKQRCRSELSSPTDVRPPENYNRSALLPRTGAKWQLTGSTGLTCEEENQMTVTARTI